MLQFEKQNQKQYFYRFKINFETNKTVRKVRLQRLLYYHYK